MPTISASQLTTRTGFRSVELASPEVLHALQDLRKRDEQGQTSGAAYFISTGIIPSSLKPYCPLATAFLARMEEEKNALALAKLYALRDLFTYLNDQYKSEKKPNFLEVAIDSGLRFHHGGLLDYREIGRHEVVWILRKNHTARIIDLLEEERVALPVLPSIAQCLLNVHIEGREMSTITFDEIRSKAIPAETNIHMLDYLDEVTSRILKIVLP